MQGITGHRGKKLRRIIKRSDLIDILKYLGVIIFIIWIISRGTDRLGYNWQWYRIPQYIFSLEDGRFFAGPLLEGLKVTFQVTGLSLILSFVFGLVAALLRLSDSIAARVLARGYLEIIRNTPLLVQLLFVYFVLSPLFGLSRFRRGFWP